jgi:hypothetical protein
MNFYSFNVSVYCFNPYNFIFLEYHFVMLTNFISHSSVHFLLMWHEKSHCQVSKNALSRQQKDDFCWCDSYFFLAISAKNQQRGKTKFINSAEEILKRKKIVRNKVKHVYIIRENVHLSKKKYNFLKKN